MFDQNTISFIVFLLAVVNFIMAIRLALKTRALRKSLLKEIVKVGGERGHGTIRVTRSFDFDEPPQCNGYRKNTDNIVIEEYF